jgi:nucleoside 2-deoxyribosyltransferase
MKIYFAGPLFTPYVRQFIASRAKVLRSAGIDAFVPHERFNQMITPQRVAELAAQGILPQTMADHFDAEEVMDLVRAGKLGRELLGLPAMSPTTIFDTDYEGLGTANAVLALLDGTQVDDGTACEIGIFYGLMQANPKDHKGIVGFITDSRGTRQRSSGWGQNMFVLGMIEAAGAIYEDFDQAVAQLLKWDAELKAG